MAITRPNVYRDPEDFDDKQQAIRVAKPHQQVSIAADDQDKENQAANRLRLRPKHLSEEPIDELVAKKQREQILKTYGLLGSKKNDIGTGAPIYWKQKFEFLKSLNVMAKDANSIEPSKLINLYYNKDKTHYEYFLCYSKCNSSDAKIKIQFHLKEEYQDSSIGYLSILSMNSFLYRYRCGSLLIQVAIEHSLRQGLGGKIKLNSTRDSGQFYFKLGFLPKSGDILEALLKGNDINGYEMYLPEASIMAWKEKITKHSVLLSQQEINQFCNNHEHKNINFSL